MNEHISFSSFLENIHIVSSANKKYSSYFALKFNSFSFININENKISDIIAFILNPKGDHEQEDRYLKLFLREYLPSVCISEEDIQKAKVYREFVTSKNRKIDILIDFDSYIIGIENKIFDNTKDQKNQLRDYLEELKRYNKDKYTLFYLTPCNKGINEISISENDYLETHNSNPFLHIKYDEHFISYIKKCSQISDNHRVRSFLDDFRKTGKISKTNLTRDELEELPGIQNASDIQVISGSLLLSTFYISSSFAKDINAKPPFDYVIVDEASQALLAMFCAAKKLGQKVILIGDPFQLPPVVELNPDIIKKKNALYFIEGLNTICQNLSVPSFQFLETYRLSTRAADYSGIFYNNNLKSSAQLNKRFQFQECSIELNKYLHPFGGPVLIKTDFPIGNDKPDFGIFIIMDLLQQLLLIHEKDFKIAIIAKTKKAVRAIQRATAATFGSDDRLSIETVERIQGLTCDITIFFIPNSSMNYSLKMPLFNVATSRATRHTFIITDKSIIDYPIAEKLVKKYLSKLNVDFSFYIKPNYKLNELGT